MSILSALGKKGRNKKSGDVSTTSIEVDFPQEGEAVTSSQYTLRIAAGQNLRGIEVSINGASWQPCRAAGGYWWFDWQGYASGPHVLLARGESETGKKAISHRREFSVKF
jgi:hypothetical protein